MKLRTAEPVVCARGLVIESLIAFCLNYTPAIVSPMFALGPTHTHTLTLTEDKRGSFVNETSKIAGLHRNARFYVKTFSVSYRVAISQFPQFSLFFAVNRYLTYN